MENEIEVPEIKLSILVCSVLGRRRTFLPSILDQIAEQIENRKDVELIVVLDNKLRTLGDKRNDLVKMAQGKFVTFIDDDDKIKPNYVCEILGAIESNKDVDVINFVVNVSLNGGSFKPCFYSKEFKTDFNLSESYHRLSNHIMCIKKELCLLAPYKPIIRGEDSAFAKDLLPFIKTEHNINEILYEYHFNQSTTETQFKIKTKGK